MSKPDKDNQAFDASKYFGIYKDLNIDVDEEASKLRQQWDRSF